ncbi:MAG: DegT/DnrJ/EryC1/StrS family aminotransferase [Nitrospirae bacterium]|nr:DegT/DnrJ/EryC1/StrS family aminotransferase [Nitrospirota bacterium]
MVKKYLLADQTIPHADIQELIAWLNTRPWLSQGPLVKEFEREWAKWLGTKHAVYVNSGSSANLLMYYAFLVSKKHKNHRVIVPAVSWPTSVAPALQLGFQPIMCDADEEDFGLDMDSLENLLKKYRPTAVTAVHVLGVPNKMDRLLALKKKYGFALLEDTCAAFGSRYDGRMVGTFGDMSTFSLFYGHHLSTIEGGMVCTDRDDLYDILLQIRSHGWAKDLSPETERKLARKYKVMEFNRPFTFYLPGFNVRSTDLNARLGLCQLRRTEHVIQCRVANHKIYQSRFTKAPGFHCQKNDRAEICSISFVALAPSPKKRDEIAARLRQNQIETRPLGGGNMSRQPFWKDRLGALKLPVSDRIAATCFQLPNHPLLEPEDIHFICDTVLTGRH